MPASKITTVDFLQQTGVDTIISNLKATLEKKNKKLVVSDVTDTKGNQYVDLVQEGGGVLGISLVGYTYVLEKMGIRFFSMAGTSAGSINAMLLACCGNKEDEKSSVIIDHLVKLEMFSFVDGKPGNNRFTRWIQKIIQRTLLGRHIIRKTFLFISWLLIFLLYLILSCFLINFFEPGTAKWFGVAASVVLVALVLIIAVAAAKFKAFAKNGYGLNEGKVFHKWINDTIALFHILGDPKQPTIRNYADFSRHYMRIPKLKVDPDPRRSNNEAPVMPMLTLIACDIVASRKIEFTQMWDLYWKSEEDVRPGDFVRASMSIPVFFETYTLTDIKSKSSFAIWDKHLNWQNEKKDIPDKVQFIDGGTLSNFPINVFYNPKYPVPRMPTFGIRLQDGILDAANQSNNSLAKYIASLFSAIRFNFDRDFITRNRAFNRGVKNIDVQQHNWLNFFMDDKEKIELFRKGAQAAADFLENFDWEVYKNERQKNYEMRQEIFEDPNNMKIFPYSQR